MKKLIALLALSVILTGCFGGEKEVNEDGVETPVVEENNDESSLDTDDQTQDPTADEDGKDNENLGDPQQTTGSESDEDVDGVSTDTSVEAQAEQEVIDEFENDLEDIFKDLGI